MALPLPVTLPTAPAPRVRPAPAPVPTPADLEAMLHHVDGPHHVEGVYYADAADADLARRRAAARIRRQLARGGRAPARLARALEAWRRWHHGDRRCVWCEQPIEAPTDAFELGGRLMHYGACQDDFDGFTGGGADA